MTDFLLFQDVGQVLAFVSQGRMDFELALPSNADSRIRNELLMPFPKSLLGMVERILGIATTYNGSELTFRVYFN